MCPADQSFNVFKLKTLVSEVSGADGVSKESQEVP